MTVTCITLKCGIMSRLLRKMEFRWSPVLDGKYWHRSGSHYLIVRDCKYFPGAFGYPVDEMPGFENDKYNRKMWRYEPFAS